MKKWSQKAVKANRKKSREGQKKRKRKPVSSPNKVSRIEAASSKKGLFHDDRFDSCFKTLDPAADFERKANRIAEEYGIPNLPRMRACDYIASIPFRKKMAYRVEILVHFHLPSGDWEGGADLVYDFDTDILIPDEWSSGVEFYYPENSPHIYERLQDAEEVFDMLIREKDELETSLTVAFGARPELVACWITGHDPESEERFEYHEREWIGLKGASYASLKMDRQLAHWGHSNEMISLIEELIERAAMPEPFGSR